jgi:hypothetical protein
MRLNKRFVLVALSIVSVLVGSIALVGCAQTGSSDDNQPDTATPAPEQGQAEDDFGTGGPGGTWGRAPGGGLSPALMAEVARILDIDQQRLEDAFAQARSGMQGTTTGEGTPAAMMARVAEILAIEQQELEDSFEEARSAVFEEVPAFPGRRPPHPIEDDQVIQA